MKSLTDLMRSPDGRELLRSSGVYVDPQEFKDRLRAPARTKLADSLDSEGRKLICSGQQLYVDYRQSVLSKILTLREFEQDPELLPFFLWVDTDRSGSDNLITKFAWPKPSKKGPVRIAPSKTRDIESRYVRLDPSQLRSAIDKLGTHLRESGVHREGAKLKYQKLRAIFIQEKPEILSSFNYRVSSFLLQNHLGYFPRPVILSETLNRGLLADEINLLLNHIDGIVRVFNESVQSHLAMGIDPQVAPRKPDYLPLFYSCDVDNFRLRLHQKVEGEDHFAVGRCKCGEDYRFFLGTKTLSIEQVARTDRWSVDVLLPAFLNNLVSGLVAGRSSGLYMMVINAVLRQVLGVSPVPILVPARLEQLAGPPEITDSLLYDYFNTKHEAPTPSRPLRVPEPHPSTMETRS